MLISVAIPAHNRPALLLEAVQSVTAQDYGVWEVVIVDDGSDPPIDRLPLSTLLGDRLRLYRNDVAQGIARAKNRAVSESRGDIILVLDDDDYGQAIPLNLYRKPLGA